MKNADVWTTVGTLSTNTHPTRGGIIDQTFVDKTWFVIFEDYDFESIKGLKSREEAFDAHENAIRSK